MRKLSLRQETLADLTTDELGSVAAASGLPCQLLTQQTCLPSQCGCTGYYPSLNAPCVSQEACGWVIDPRLTPQTSG